jgi:acyl-CoA synthetase (NDP forming)
MRSLNRLLNPRSIAVVGGGTWCENVLKQCHAFGYTGQLTAVHQKRSEVAGFPAVSSLDQLNEVPDAIFVGVNRHATIEVIREAARLGAGGRGLFCLRLPGSSGRTGRWRWPPGRAGGSSQ